MDKWINVCDHFPPVTEGLSHSKAVIVWCPERRNKYSAVWFPAGKCWSYFGNSGKLTEEVTHWTPLPAPPERP